MLRQKLFKDFLKNKKNLEARNQLIELHYPLAKKQVLRLKILYFISFLIVFCYIFYFYKKVFDYLIKIKKDYHFR
ncbi:MAG: hypothetical protein AB2N28_6180 [Candidatus Phytoplasma solani]